MRYHVRELPLPSGAFDNLRQFAKPTADSAYFANPLGLAGIDLLDHAQGSLDLPGSASRSAAEGRTTIDLDRSLGQRFQPSLRTSNV